MPGCLPEMEPGTFDTEEEARRFIEDEQTDWLEAAVEGGFDTHDDPYAYWYEECSEEHSPAGTE